MINANGSCVKHYWNVFVPVILAQLPLYEKGQFMSIENNPIPRPRFTGIFLPVEILEMPDLSFLDQILLAWIDALFDDSKGGCWASNKYLSEKLKVQENTVAKSLTNLRSFGLIEDISFDGRTRVIKAMIGRQIHKSQSKSGLDKNPIGVGQKSNPAMDENPNPSYIYSKEESKERIGLSTSLSHYFFSKLKEINPTIKQPNFSDWAKSFDTMINEDKRSEDQIKEAINFIHSEHFNSEKDFTWSKAVVCPEKLRKHFSKIWLIIHKPNPQAVKQTEENKKVDVAIENSEWAKKIVNFIDEKWLVKFHEVLKISPNFVSLTAGKGFEPLAYTEHGFKERVRNHLRKSGVVFKQKE